MIGTPNCGENQLFINMTNLELEKRIIIVGPRSRVGKDNILTVNTTSRAGWSSDLSPFKLGPCQLWDGRVSQTMENAWQYSKVYKEHWNDKTNTLYSEWFVWSDKGFENPRAVRYPMGKGAKPIGSWWNCQLLDYITARKNIYLPLYRDSVKKTQGYLRLWDEWHDLAPDGKIQLWDFDAWDHHGAGYTLKQVLNEPNKIMGHAFVLAMMLVYGDDFQIEDLE